MSALRKETICERDYAYNRSSNREKIKIIRLQLVLKNIILRNSTTKSKPLFPYQKYIAISN